ncbi:hypothetical protein GCM10022268_06540 [Sphingomonas cynarae]|uniref:Integrase catalytic domain-containing protein n=1 Tax=Sphingomonas cynarae TaxID=930197 RepID=A0ABP7D0A8_9SPHN
MEKLMADHGFSERRACRLIGVNRSAWQYEPLRGKDEAVRERMREIANERRRFGYRRLAILLGREGKGMNLKKVYRLYREERLTVRKRGGRKRAPGTRAPMAIPQEPNQRWSLDFVSDALACGRRFRVLNIIDDDSRECLACIADTSLSGRRVMRELTAIAERRGLPCMVVSDNGTELTPAFRPAATRDRPVLSRMSAGEATGGVNPARCCSSSAANAAGVASPSEECGRSVLSSSTQRARMALAWPIVKNSVSLSSSSRMRPLKLSTNPFCVGLPGAM